MEEKKITFNQSQIEYMIKNGIDKNNLDDVFEKTKQLLILKGFDDEYKPTESGIMCESILDTLFDMGY